LILEKINNKVIHKIVVDLRIDPSREGGDDGRRPKPGPITRSMARYTEAQEESETLTHIQMLTTLSFDGHL